MTGKIKRGSMCVVEAGWGTHKNAAEGARRPLESSASFPPPPTLRTPALESSAREEAARRAAGMWGKLASPPPPKSAPGADAKDEFGDGCADAGADGTGGSVHVPPP